MPTGRLLFERSARFDDPSGETGTSDLVVLDIATGTVLMNPWPDDLMPSWQSGSRAWTPDGATVITVVDVPPYGDEQRVVALPVAPGAPPIAFPAVHSIDSPAASPDGRWITYVDDSTSHPVIQLARADGTGDPTVLVRDARGDLPSYAWSPDGQTIAAVTSTGDEDGGGTIVLVDVASGVVSDLGVASGGSLYWSPDGRWLAFTGATRTCRWCVVDVASGDVLPITSDDLGGDPGAGVLGWSGGDSPEVLIVSGDGTLYRTDAHAGAATSVAKIGAAGMPVISPDGRWLAYSLLDLTNGSASLAAVSLEDGRIVELTQPDPTMNDVGVSWQPAPVDVPWPTWSQRPAPTPGPTPLVCEVQLDVTGDRVLHRTLALPADPGFDGFGLRAGVEGEGGPVAVTLELSPQGKLVAFGLVIQDFTIAAGGSVPLEPPAVVLAPGSDATAGAVTFNGLPGQAITGTIDGQVSWQCPPPGTSEQAGS